MGSIVVEDKAFSTYFSLIIVSDLLKAVEAFVPISVNASSCILTMVCASMELSFYSYLWIIKKQSKYWGFHTHFPDHFVSSRHYLKGISYLEEALQNYDRSVYGRRLDLDRTEIF